MIRTCFASCGILRSLDKLLMAMGELNFKEITIHFFFLRMENYEEEEKMTHFKDNLHAISNL